jgi:hypothetical protein
MPVIYTLGTNRRAADSWEFQTINANNGFHHNVNTDNTQVNISHQGKTCDTAVLTAMVNGFSLSKEIYACDTIYGPDTIYDNATYTLPGDLESDGYGWILTNSNAFGIIKKLIGSVPDKHMTLVSIKQLGQWAVLKCMAEGLEFSKRIFSPPAPKIVGNNVLIGTTDTNTYTLSDDNFTVDWNIEGQGYNSNARITRRYNKRVDVVGTQIGNAILTASIKSEIGEPWNVNRTRIVQNISKTLLISESPFHVNYLNDTLKFTLGGHNICVPLPRSNINIKHINGIAPQDKDNRNVHSWYINSPPNNFFKWILTKKDTANAELKLQWNNDEGACIVMKVWRAGEIFVDSLGFLAYEKSKNKDIFVRRLQKFMECGKCVLGIQNDNMVTLLHKDSVDFPAYQKSSQLHCGCLGTPKPEYLFFPKEKTPNLYLKLLKSEDNQYKVEEIKADKITQDICRSIKPYIQKVQ